MRGQVAIEFIIGIGIVLLVVLVAGMYNQAQVSQAENLRTMTRLSAHCDQVASALNSVYVSGRESQQLVLNDLNVWMDGNTVYVNDVNKRAWEGISCAHASSISGNYNFTGNFTVRHTRSGMLLE